LSDALGTSVSAPSSIDWSPQGQAILVGFRDGGIASAPIGNGSPKLLISPDAARRPQGAAWSPTGQEFAFLDRSGASQPQALSRAGIAAGTPTPAKPTVVAPSGDSAASIASFAGLPDGRSLLFTQSGGVLGSGSTDLWRIGIDGSDRKLVASAGVAAPVAQVAQFAPSSDGRGVAYAIDVPTDAGPRFDSLWIRDLESGRPTPLPLPSGLAATRLWWTSAGLVVEANIQATPGTPVAARSMTTVLVLVRPTGRPEELLRFTTGPVATPIARATPMAPAEPAPATP
jgi:dipeptidyl aminopeptidase/acylaminoacyl peptidase